MNAAIRYRYQALYNVIIIPINGFHTTVFTSQDPLHISASFGRTTLDILFPQHVCVSMYVSNIPEVFQSFAFSRRIMMIWSVTVINMNDNRSLVIYKLWWIMNVINEYCTAMTFQLEGGFYSTGLPLRRLCKDRTLLKWLPRDPETLDIALVLPLCRPELLFGPTSASDERGLRASTLPDRSWFALTSSWNSFSTSASVASVSFRWPWATSSTETTARLFWRRRAAADVWGRQRSVELRCHGCPFDEDLRRRQEPLAGRRADVARGGRTSRRTRDETGRWVCSREKSWARSWTAVARWGSSASASSPPRRRSSFCRVAPDGRQSRGTRTGRRATQALR